MRVLDPGHSYELQQLDGDGVERLTFVKRCNPPEKFPDNHNAYSGTILQECWRAEIDRLKYVDGQIHDVRNLAMIGNLRENLRLIEERAAERHGRLLRNVRPDIEKEPTCTKCGHIQHQCAEEISNVRE